MKIGVFDSGLGGLIVTHGILQTLPEYDYLYLGDTARVPYGNRSPETVYRFTCEAVDYLFAQDCRLIVLACNTASAEALRRIQQEYLPARYPGRQVLGVLIPAAEAAITASVTGRIGVLATAGTVQSGTFVSEITKLRPETEVSQQAAPLLVPLIEYDGLKFAPPILAEYLAPLRAADIDCVILGCTHYPVLQTQVEHYFGPGVSVIAQNQVVPGKLRSYLTRHPEIERDLTHGYGRAYQVTDLTVGAQTLAGRLFSGTVSLELIPALG